MIFLSLALIPALINGVDGSTDAAASVMRSYDLSTLRIDYDAGGQPMLMFSGAMNSDSDLLNSETGPGVSSTDAFTVLALLQSAMSSEWQYEGRELMLDQRGRLRVVAPEEVQQRVVSLLQELESAVGASVGMELSLVRVPNDPLGGGLVSDEEALALLSRASQGGGTISTTQIDTRTGETAEVELAHNVMHLVDYDVEIAQGSWVYDPIVMVASLGLNAQLRATSLDGGLALALSMRHGDLLSMREREIDMKGHMGSEMQGVAVLDGPKLLQSPRMMTQSVVLNTFLPEGQALVVPMESSVSADAYSSALVLRKTGGGGAVQFAGEHLQLTNLEALELPAFAVNGSAFATGYETSDISQHAFSMYRMPERAFVALQGTNRDMAMSIISSGRSRSEIYGPWAISAAQEERSVVESAPEVRVAEVALTLYRGDQRLAATVLPVRGGEVGAVVLGVQDALLVF